MMCIRPWFAVAAALILGSGETVAQQSPGAQYPAPVDTFELDAGRRFDLRPGEPDIGWYRLTYKGALVREQGTPFKAASALDIAAEQPPSTAAGGDRHRWTLRYDGRSARLGGGLFEAAGVQPIALRGFDKLDLRGTAAVSTDEEGRNVQLAVGLEAPPFRIPGLAGTEVSNWVTLGVNAQRGRSPSDEVENRALVTYRAFAGKAFGWRKSASAAVTAGKLAGEVLAQATSLEEAKKLAEQVAKIAVLKRTVQQKLLLDAIGETEEAADWEKTVRALAFGFADAITDQPTLALYAEATGWYGRRGDGGGRGHKGLVTVTLDYWFLASRDDMFLRLRYEQGYEWAAPTERKKHLIASIALRF